MLRSSAMSRTEIGSVIRIYSIRDCRKSAHFCDFAQYIEKFVLAVITAVAGIGAIGRIVQLVRFHEFVPYPGMRDEVFQFRAIICGIARGNRRDRKRIRAKRPMCNPRQIRGIRPARNRNQQGRDFRQPREKRFFFARGIICDGFQFANLYERIHYEKYIPRGGRPAYGDCST